MTLPAPISKRLILQPAEARPPFWGAAEDYRVVWRSERVGRIDRDPRPYPVHEHVPWRWFLNDGRRQRMASGRAATRDEAMVAFRNAWETVPDNTVAKSANNSTE